MLSTAAVATPPGFFSFRWRPATDGAAFEDIAIVFKVPGGVDMAVLPDLLEGVCRGPLVPQAVILIHLLDDDSLVEAMSSASAQAAMVRFDGRLPLMILAIDPKTFTLRLSVLQGVLSNAKIASARRTIGSVDDWIRAGLSAVFEPSKVVVTAPAGYAFHKPSSKRSSYFIRADQALTTSGAVSFVALAILKRLLTTHGRLPVGLKLLFVDTMSVATAAFALRELLAYAGVSPLPQVDSFHSYGGMNDIGEPLPGSSLCIISASSSMNLHREWVETKRVYDRDVLTLVTFEDAKGKEHALFALPSSAKPLEVGSTAKYDIRIAGENFFPVNEPPRKVLIATTHHACSHFTDIYHDQRGKQVFDIFRTADSSRRGLFVDGDRLMASTSFRRWVDSKMPHWLKASTTQVVFQGDESSKALARHIAHILTLLGSAPPSLLSIADVSGSTVNPNGALVAAATVVNRGNALLSLSRELRNVHRGPRLYVIGVQVAQSEAGIRTFDKNLKHSASGACIDVLRMQTCLIDESVGGSFQQELTELYALARSMRGVPSALIARAASLRSGKARESNLILLPTRHDLDVDLSLNEGFAFWPKGYEAGLFQAEILGTMAAIVQNARTNEDVPSDQRLRSPTLVQVALDPENFARFNDSVLQASLLRTALPSELDYRGDVDASNYMRIALERIAQRMGDEDQAELEFLTAMATGRLRLADGDTLAVVAAFRAECKGRNTPLLAAVRFLLGRIASSNAVQGRVAF